MEQDTLKVSFYGGTGSVTGANFLLELPKTDTDPGKKFLIDCGLTQGTKVADDLNWNPFEYDPKEIDILFVTHSHIDHVGRIPKLLHDGFTGRIISTIATKDLAAVMLADTVGILSKDTEHGLDQIYTQDAVKKAMSLWEGIEYHQVLNIDHGFQFSFYDAGHILGSGMLKVSYKDKHILFTGDLGNSPSPLLKDTEIVEGIDYLIMESVYGDRNHENRDMRRKLLESVIEDNYKTKGTLIIPTFSLERSQELLFEIDMLVEHDRVPKMPVFFDSPLAIHLTKIFKQHQECFNETARQFISEGDDIFSFPGLKVTLLAEESKAILAAPDPKIIIAGSGMSNGGRIIHHEKNYLANPNNTLLLTGYQSIGTMGRLIEQGAKTVTIYGEAVPVHARIVKISGYSGHKDSDNLLEFVEKMSPTLEKVFVVMGEPKSAMFLVQKLRDLLGVNAIAPDRNLSVVLPMKK